MGFSYDSIISYYCSLTNSFDDAYEIKLRTHIDTLRYKVMMNGDITSYHELEKAYKGDSIYQNMFIYSLTMANKYNYIRANKDICEEIKAVYSKSPNLGEMNKESMWYLNYYSSRFDSLTKKK